MTTRPPLFRAVAPYAYGADPFITFQYWPAVGQQIEIYLHFLKTFKHETEWFSFLDIDEFFVLKGVDNIAAFHAGLRIARSTACISTGSSTATAARCGERTRRP